MKKTSLTKKAKTAKRSKTSWSPLPQKGFKEWFGDWLVSSAAIKFYHENKRWPSFINTDFVKVRGRAVTLQLK